MMVIQLMAKQIRQL
jgi:acyl-CoA oxidase